MTALNGEWRDIPGHPGYQASSHGQIRSLDRMVRCALGQRQVRGRVLHPSVQGNDRILHLYLSPWGTRKVARLILETFCGPCPDGMVAYHKDGNFRNNHIGNLEWAPRRGRERVLKEDEVREIRSRVGGGESIAQLARELGVNSKTVWDVANWKTWTWLE